MLASPTFFASSSHKLTEQIGLIYFLLVTKAICLKFANTPIFCILGEYITLWMRSNDHLPIINRVIDRNHENH